MIVFSGVFNLGFSFQTIIKKKKNECSCCVCVCVTLQIPGPIRPHAVIILPNKAGTEVLVCYEDEGVYIDTYGRITKDTVLQWGEMPTSVGNVGAHIFMQMLYTPIKVYFCTQCIFVQVPLTTTQLR